MADRYDDMSTADLLREVCRKLDRIEKQGAPVHVHNGKVTGRTEMDRAVQRHLTRSATDFDGTVYPRRPGALCGY